MPNKVKIVEYSYFGEVVKKLESLHNIKIELQASCAEITFSDGSSFYLGVGEYDTHIDIVIDGIEYQTEIH